jgi:hypothetical protein
MRRRGIVWLLVAACGLLTVGCGGDEAPDQPAGAEQGRRPVEGMPTRTLNEDEQALVGLWSLELPGTDDKPGLTVELDLFDGGAQRFTITNPPGAPAGTVQTNEGVWWLEGLDRLLLSPRRSQGKDLPAGSAAETVLKITEAGLIHADARTDRPLVRRKP